jgi:hypothetical protein
VVAWRAGDLTVTAAEWDSAEQLGLSSGQPASLVPGWRGPIQFLHGDTTGVQESARLARERGDIEGAVALEGLIWAKRGQRDSAVAIATRLEKGDIPYYDLDAALIWLALADTTRALRVLERRPQEAYRLLSPNFAGLHGNPRYEAVLAAAWRRVRTDGPEPPR